MHTDSTRESAEAGRILVRSGVARLGNSTAEVELANSLEGDWRVRLYVTVGGAAEAPITVYAGESYILAFHFYNRTARHMTDSGFKGHLAEADPTEMLEEVTAYLRASGAFAALAEELHGTAAHDVLSRPD